MPPKYPSSKTKQTASAKQKAYKQYGDAKRPKKVETTRIKGVPQSIQALLPNFSVELGLEKQAAKMALIRLWQQQLPDGYKDIAVATGLIYSNNRKSAQLMVSVPHGALATELQLMGPALCEALNQYAPQTGVTLSGIKVSVKR